MMNLMIANDADIVTGSNSCSIRGESLKGKVLTGEEALIKHIEDHSIGYSSCAKLYRTDVVRDIRFVEGRKINEDSFFVFQCFSKVKKCLSSGILGKQRIKCQSIFRKVS